MADKPVEPADQSPPERKRRPVRISLKMRWVSGGVGVSCLGAGAVATFTRTVEAGPVALIASGALFLVMAIGGVMPTRIKFGDNEAEWQTEEIGQQIAEITSLVPPEDQPQALEVLERMATVNPVSAGPGIAAVAFEQEVLAALRAAWPEVVDDDFRVRVDNLVLVAGRSEEAPRYRDAGYDALVLGPAGPLVVIEIFATAPSPGRLRGTIERARALAPDGALLLIAKEGAFAGIVNDFDNSEFVHVLSTQRPYYSMIASTLRTTIEQALRNQGPPHD